MSVRGIVTERDLLHCAAGTGSLFSEVRVAEVMSTHLVTGSPNDSVQDVIGVMTQPDPVTSPVLSDGRLVGLVSIGDVVKAQHDQLAMENGFMKDYIQS